MHARPHQSMRPARLLAVLAALAVIAAAPRAQAGGEGYTFHQALTGAAANTIDFGDVPMRNDVVVLYEHNFGLFPRINRETGALVNGGLPQHADMLAHVYRCWTDLNRHVPDPDFDGYIVLDYESWTPWWEDTPALYRNQTLREIHNANPSWSDAEVEARAKEIYELHARNFFEQTLRHGRSMRPKAKWGLWSYPKARHTQYDTQWLWDLHDAVYPSIYMRNSLVPSGGDEPGQGEEYVHDYIANRFDGRLTLARELAGPDRPVLAFAWPRYTHRNENQWLRLRLVKESDLLLMLLGPYYWDADGVIIWDNLPQSSLADVFQQYVDETMGPMITDIDNELATTIDDLPEDVNGDGVVNTSDLAYVIQRFGTDDEAADVNDDGIVDYLDMLLVLSAMSA